MAASGKSAAVPKKSSCARMTITARAQASNAKWRRKLRRAIDIPPVHRQIGGGRLHRYLIHHVADVTAVIGGVIDHVQDDIAAAHAAAAAADELEIHDLRRRGVAQGIGITDIPSI